MAIHFYDTTRGWDIKLCLDIPYTCSRSLFGPNLKQTNKLYVSSDGGLEIISLGLTTETICRIQTYGLSLASKFSDYNSCSQNVWTTFQLNVFFHVLMKRQESTKRCPSSWHCWNVLKAGATRAFKETVSLGRIAINSRDMFWWLTQKRKTNIWIRDWKQTQIEQRIVFALFAKEHIQVVKFSWHFSMGTGPGCIEKYLQGGLVRVWLILCGLKAKVHFSAHLWAVAGLLQRITVKKTSSKM